MKFVVKNAVPAVTIAAKKRAFSLVEMLIVISILGIMAAIIIPAMKDHSQKAKEAAAKDNLRILRAAIERYKLDHNGVPPGYINGEPIEDFLISGQLTQFTAPNGDYQSTKSGIYRLNPYINEMPINPFNRKNSLTVVETFPSPASEATGWYYKPSTGEIRLNTDGVDSTATPFAEY